MVDTALRVQLMHVSYHLLHWGTPFHFAPHLGTLNVKRLHFDDLLEGKVDEELAIAVALLMERNLSSNQWRARAEM